jgi:GTP cyclohydrolase I
VEANQSAESAKRLVEKLLAALGHDVNRPGVFEIAV